MRKLKNKSASMIGSFYGSGILSWSWSMSFGMPWSVSNSRSWSGYWSVSGSKSRFSRRQSISGKRIL